MSPAGFAEADSIYEGTFETCKVQHAHMETHGSIAWLNANGRLHVRTSTQTPHLTKAKLAYLFGLYPEQIHLYLRTRRRRFRRQAGNAHRGPLCAGGPASTGRPVKWEFTRTEEFIGSVSRHPMKITIKLGAKKDGTLTAMQIHTVSNTGAYGNHGGERLASSLGSAMATYRCRNKKGIGYAVYTNTVPSGAFRGYGATQPAFAMESADRRTGAQLGIDPSTMRRKNMVRAGDPAP